MSKKSSTPKQRKKLSNRAGANYYARIKSDPDYLEQEYVRVAEILPYLRCSEETFLRLRDWSIRQNHLGELILKRSEYKDALESAAASRDAYNTPYAKERRYQAIQDFFLSQLSEPQKVYAITLATNTKFSGKKKKVRHIIDSELDKLMVRLNKKLFGKKWREKKCYAQIRVMAEGFDYTHLHFHGVLTLPKHSTHLQKEVEESLLSALKTFDVKGSVNVQANPNKGWIDYIMKEFEKPCRWRGKENTEESFDRLYISSPNPHK